MSIPLVHLRAVVLLGAAFVVGCSSAPPAPVVSKEARGEIVGGYVVHPDKTYEGQVAQERAIARKQEQELKRQRREQEDIERQQIYDARENLYLKGRAAAEDERPAEAAEPVQGDPEPFVAEPPVKEPVRRQRY